MAEASSKSRPRVFISSTVLDLREHRAAVVDACLRVGVGPLIMEDSAAADSDPLARSRALLDQADIYVGILTFRYGFVPPGREKSLAEIEFEYAGARGIPRLVFLMSEDHPVRVQDVETGHGAAKLLSFKTTVRRSSLVAEFRSPDELKAAVVTVLVKVLGDRSRHLEPPTALLLFPFGSEHDDVRSFVAEKLKREGVRVLQLDEMLQPGAIWANAIADAIRRADFVVVDITNANPNITYELGYAHALRKPTIILGASDAIPSVPSDLAGFQVLTYDRHDLGPLVKPFARLLREYVKEGRR